MLKKWCFVFCLIPLLGAGCAGGGFGRPTLSSYEGSALSVQNSVAIYQKRESGLTVAQRQQFKEAYDGICSAYRTAGILLSSVTDSVDETSAHTAMVSYQRTMAALPNLIDGLARLAATFK